MVCLLSGTGTLLGTGNTTGMWTKSSPHSACILAETGRYGRVIHVEVMLPGAFGWPGREHLRPDLMGERRSATRGALERPEEPRRLVQEAGEKVAGGGRAGCLLELFQVDLEPDAVVREHVGTTWRWHERGVGVALTPPSAFDAVVKSRESVQGL